MAEEKPKFPPGIGKPRTRLPGHLKPHKFNSTNSLYIDSTLSKPKKAELMHCIAEYFCRQILSADQANKEARQEYQIFDETKHPLMSKDTRSILEIPTVEQTERLVKSIFNIGQLAHESLVMAVAYLDRIKEHHPLFQLFTFNWRRVILSCLILASKVWEDQAVWNVDFLDLFPLATPHDLGQLEKKLLSLLSFDVSLKASEYAKIYFDLRAESHSGEDHFSDLKPLGKDAEEKLELRSHNYFIKHNLLEENPGKLYRSTGSVDNIKDLTSQRKH